MKLITFYGGPCHNTSIFVTDGTAAINMAFFDRYDDRKADQTRPHQIANYIESEPGSLRFVHAPQRKAPNLHENDTFPHVHSLALVHYTQKPSA